MGILKEENRRKFSPLTNSGTRVLFLRTYTAIESWGTSCFTRTASRESVSSKLGSSLSLDDTLSLLSVRVKQLVTHDSMAVYVLRNKTLVPEFVSGENFRLFSSLRIPIGEGLSGWVAQNVKAILNGNPSVEPGYLNDPTKYSTLRSALAVPLECTSSVVAVLAGFRARHDGFIPDAVNGL